MSDSLHIHSDVSSPQPSTSTGCSTERNGMGRVFFWGTSSVWSSTTIIFRYQWRWHWLNWEQHWTHHHHHHHQEVGQEAERSLRARGASGATGRGHGGGREQNRENVDVGRTDENGLIMTVNQILFPSLGIQVSSVTLRMPQHLWIVFQFLLMSSFYKDLLNRQISRYNRSLPWKWTPHPALYFPCGKKSSLLRMRFLLWLWTWGWFGSQKSSNTGREIHCLKLQSSESTCPGTDIWPSSHSFTSLTVKQGKTKSMFVYLYSYCFPQSLFSWSSFSYFRLMDFLFRFLVFLFLHL